MSYATKQRMIDRFGQDNLVELTDRADPPTGAINDTVLQVALDAADEEINSFLSARYKLPLDPVPQMIADLACDIARHRLYRHSRPDNVKNDYDAAMKALREIVTGTRQLTAAGIEPAGPAVTTAPAATGPDRIFSRESMKGY